MTIPMKTIPGYVNSKPGIQVGTKMEGPITRDAHGRLQADLQGVRFLQQMGVEWVMINDQQVPEHSAACYREIRDLLAEHGLKIYRLANGRLHNMSAVTLGLEDRDRMIDRYNTSATWARRGSTTPPTPTWATASGAARAASPFAAAPPPGAWT